LIAILDFGLGNVQAFINIYKNLGIPVIAAKKPNDLIGATHLILPGVGAFDATMSQLERSGMKRQLDYLVLDKKIPVLGICVGMQIMGRSSSEGCLNGLSWMDAEILRFNKNHGDIVTTLPHMGWNQVIQKNRPIKLLEGIDGEYFYFLHSYFFSPNDFSIIGAETFYGEQFTSVVMKDNIYGVQFHPEKSHNPGTRLLKNFSSV
jgi:glutamine amidotransferase